MNNHASRFPDSFDRGELERVANSADYRVGSELKRLIDEIESESEDRSKENLPR
jgi:hypothetical protein